MLSLNLSVAQILENLSHSEKMELGKEIEKLVSDERSIYLQNTIEYFKGFTTEDLKVEIRKTFKVLKIKNNLHDIRSFASYVNVQVPKGHKSGLSSRLYRDKAAMAEFMARILQRYGKLVDGRYTITFPI